MKRSKKDGTCPCTDKELRKVLAMDVSEFYKRDGAVGHVTPEEWDKPYYNPKLTDVAKVRLVCKMVLKCRPYNKHAEREILTRVLGKPTNWGRMGQHMDAVSYLMKNVCPHFVWDLRTLSATHRRRLERELAKPIYGYAERWEIAAQNRAEAARRIARKAARQDDTSGEIVR